MIRRTLVIKCLAGGAFIIVATWMAAGLWHELYLRIGFLRLSFQRGGAAIWWDFQSLPASAYTVGPVGSLLQAPMWVEHARGGVRGLVVPYWSLLLPVVTAIVLLWFRKEPKSANSCDECGYDLRGNESGSCPECGTRITGITN